MSRVIRKTLVQAKLESTYGTDPGGWSASDAVLVSNASINLVRENAPRELLRGYMGGSEALVAARRIEIEFEVEVAGSGSAGTAPAWGPLMRACGMAETISAGSHVEYTPVSTGFESIALRYVLDGVTHLALGARGSVSFQLGTYGRPVMRFSFTGLDGGATAATATASFGSWQKPEVVSTAAPSQLLLGPTYSAGTGAFTGGSALDMRNLEIDLGHTVSHIQLLGSEEVDITAREAVGKMSVALSAADEVTWHGDIVANALAAFGFEHGGTPGNIVRLFAPSVQRTAPQVEDYEGRVLLSCDLRLVPQSGDDELVVVAA